MSDEPLVLGEPDVIQKEYNILWLRAEIERLQSDRDEWVKLWEKASMSVLSLQSRIDDLTAAWEHNYKMLKESHEIEERLQSRIELLEGKQDYKALFDGQKVVVEIQQSRIEVLEAFVVRLMAENK